VYTPASAADPAGAVQHRSHPPEPAALSAPEASHFGEIIDIDQQDAICLIEITPGVCLRTRIPITMLAHLHPFPGVEFVWTPQGDELLALGLLEPCRAALARRR
jgi:hypothetical protein